MSSAGIPERVKNNVLDLAVKEILIGKDPKLIKAEIAVKINRDPSIDNKQVDDLYEEARKISGIDYSVYSKDSDNKTVRENQINEIITTAISKIEKGGDNEDIINRAEDDLRKLKLSEGNVQRYLNQIYDRFDYSKEVSEDKEFHLEEGKDLVPLPMIDIDYDEMKNIKLPEEEEGVIAPLERPFLTKKEMKLSSDYSKIEDFNKQTYSGNLIKTPGNLVVETQKLEDYIRQVKLCALALPAYISKLRMEDLLVNLLSRIEDKFNNIYVFGWERQINTEYYKQFDELKKMNDDMEGSLFIIRDIKTFNIYVADLFKFGVTKNYFIVLLNGLITKDDVTPVESLTKGNSFLWPAFADFKVMVKKAESISYIYGKHEQVYLKSLSSTFPIIRGEKETWRNIEANSQVLAVGRKILNVDLSGDNINENSKSSGLTSLSKPALNLDEAIRRSPKFRDIIITIFANSESRILLKIIPGASGLDDFTYIYERMKKTPIKPTIIRRVDDFVSKRAKIKSVPSQGPCLIITDYTLTDQLTPLNIDKFYIAGGGEPADIETINDLIKAENYTKDIYPRRIEVKNFVTRLDSVVDTVDEIDFQAFDSLRTRAQENLLKIKQNSLSVNCIGDRLYVNKGTY